MDRALENRVGFWPRGLAFIIDGLLLSAIGYLLHRPLSALFPNAVAAVTQELTARTSEMLEGAPFLERTARSTVATTLVAPFYWLLEVFAGWSPAKFFLGLRIVTEAGKKAPLLPLFLRYAVKNAAPALLVIALFTSWRGFDGLANATYWATVVGFFAVLAPGRMALHDRIAGTAVLRKADVVVPATTERATSSS